MPSRDGKVARSMQARRGLIERVRARAALVRDTSRPLVWMHAPSVGEGLQARPVAHALRAQHPEVQLAYTFFSPSAARFAESIGADITDYLPFDGASECDAMLDALKPAALVFVKLDVWPVLVARAVARGIPVALLSATVAPGSSRLGALSRLLLHDAYAALRSVGAIDAPNGARLQQLGVRVSALRVTGDTRFDQVWARAQSVDRASPLLTTLVSARPTLVAGSTWPADESVLLESWMAIRRACPTARLIVAPHEPTEAHLAPLAAWANTQRLRAVRLSRLETSESPADRDADVIIVDRVGVLGDVYAIGDAAFVGGGFHAAGLHSVIEPAAFGIPVAFGPRHTMSREAGLLLAAGGGASITTARALTEVASQWLSDRKKREREGERAREVVRAELGATDRSVALVEGLLAV
jgi:3-deoxy-D-manno-octulosonic-acid transferase